MTWSGSQTSGILILDILDWEFTEIRTSKKIFILRAKRVPDTTECAPLFRSVANVIFMPMKFELRPDFKLLWLWSSISRSSNQWAIYRISKTRDFAPVQVTISLCNIKSLDLLTIKGPTEWPRQIETKIEFFEFFRNLKAKRKKYHKRWIEFFS